MTLYHLLDRAAKVHRDRPAVAKGARALHSFAGLDERARRIGGAMREALGLARGDCVAVIAKNCPEYFEIVFGCWAAGLIAVPANAKLAGPEFAYILTNSGARAVFVTDDLAETVAGAMRDAACVERMVVIASPEYERLLGSDPVAVEAMDRDDVAWLFHTSGTTGKPKGAMLTHGNLMAMTTSYFLDIDQIAPGEAIVHPAPLSHGAGCYVMPHIAAGAVNVVPDSGGFEPAELFETIAAWPGSSLFAAPTMVKRLVDHVAIAAPASDNLKTIIYGGGPMYVADVKRALDSLGPKLAQLYGQGEAPMCITGLAKAYYADRKHPRWEARIGSAGFAQTVVEVAVFDENDRPLPAGEAGEVVCRGASVMKGYWRNPSASAETLRGGWLHTGDVGAFDADGFLTLMDRSKDLIISGGTNIYPREVEEVLLTHPAVAEVSVVGEPDPDWGENVVAFVQCAAAGTHGETVSAAALDAHVTAQIARFKRPKRYVFVDALPKNNYGKILKRELRDRLSAEREQPS